MNVFAVSSSPVACAQALDDKRLNKMILETAQILCSVFKRWGYETPYRVSHANHPITLWASEKYLNLRWLYSLGMAYGDEIIYRKGRRHSSHDVIYHLGESFVWLTEPPQPEDVVFYNGARHKKLGLDFTHLSVHKAYRAYLNARWPGDKRAPVWTNRKKPRWSTY